MSHGARCSTVTAPDAVCSVTCHALSACAWPCVSTTFVCAGSQGTEQLREPLVQPAAAGARRALLAAGGPAAGGDDAGGARRPVRPIIPSNSYLAASCFLAAGGPPVGGDDTGGVRCLVRPIAHLYSWLLAESWRRSCSSPRWCVELLQLHIRALHCMESLDWRQPMRRTTVCVTQHWGLSAAAAAAAAAARGRSPLH